MEKIDLSYQEQSYQMITKYIDQSTAIKQSVTRQAEPQYILCSVLAGLSMCWTSQVPTVPRMSSPTPSAAFGSQIWIIMTEAPTTCLSIL